MNSPFVICESLPSGAFPMCGRDQPGNGRKEWKGCVGPAPQGRFFSNLIQGVSKKRYFLDFLSYFSSIGRILLFHMCFGIRISSPFHLAIQKVSIQNLNCPKNACADMIFIPALRSEDWAGIKIMSAHAFLAFLGQLRFWMDTFWIARWNGLKILIPKHMWKSKIRPLELK